jgi:hypothetical protein
MTNRRYLIASALLLLGALPAGAQQRSGVMGELIKDVAGVQSKLTALAKAVPADKYDWRPGAGVRSIGEVFLHVSGDNYVMPGLMGIQPDPSTGIDVKDFKTVGVFEKQELGQDAMVAAMEKSFAHLKKAMSDTPDSKLEDHVKFFGQDMTVREVWIATTTHLHEHLGQSIAYARSNNIVPPWSK